MAMRLLLLLPVLLTVQVFIGRWPRNFNSDVDFIAGLGGGYGESRFF